MVGGIVNNEPQIWFLVCVSLHVSNVGPEQRISLWGWPYTLYNVVADKCVLWHPLYYVTTVHGRWKTDKVKVSLPALWLNYVQQYPKAWTFYLPYGSTMSNSIPRHEHSTCPTDHTRFFWCRIIDNIFLLQYIVFIDTARWDYTVLCKGRNLGAVL